MSDSSSELLEMIKREMALLSVQLDSYQALYLLEQGSRRNLMDDTAPGFFAVVQVSMVESILMRVARLMDPLKSSGQSNASFSSLFSDDAHRSVEPEWQGVLNEWKDDGRFGAVRRLRNKHLGHNDLGVWEAKRQGEAWIPITADEFDAVTSLSQALWALLRSVRRKAHEADLLPPPAMRGESPTQILRCLAGGTFLDELLERDDLMAEAARLGRYVQDRVGSELAAPCIER
jgi:hypothetical protein